MGDMNLDVGMDEYTVYGIRAVYLYSCISVLWYDQFLTFKCVGPA